MFNSPIIFKAIVILKLESVTNRIIVDWEKISQRKTIFVEADAVHIGIN